MSIVDLADEKLGARDVVRSNRTALGDALTEHADTRHRDGLPWNVFARWTGRGFLQRLKTTIAIPSPQSSQRSSLVATPREEAAKWQMRVSLPIIREFNRATALLFLACLFAILPAARGDIPWPEVVQRLAYEN